MVMPLHHPADVKSLDRESSKAESGMALPLIHTCVFFGKIGVDFLTSHRPRMKGYRATKEEVLNLSTIVHREKLVFIKSPSMKKYLYQ